MRYEHCEDETRAVFSNLWKVKAFALIKVEWVAVFVSNHAEYKETGLWMNSLNISLTFFKTLPPQCKIQMNKKYAERKLHVIYECMNIWDCIAFVDPPQNWWSHCGPDQMCWRHNERKHWSLKDKQNMQLRRSGVALWYN